MSNGPAPDPFGAFISVVYEDGSTLLIGLVPLRAIPVVPQSFCNQMETIGAKEHLLTFLSVDEYGWGAKSPLFKRFLGVIF